MTKLGVLIVGQTPPPYGGQAIIIDNLVHGTYEQIDVHHVRMEFSETLSDARKFSVTKVLHVFELIAKVLWARLRTGATVLYYPPSGPTRHGVLRDLVVLPSVRWAFRDTVFHFHAGGISEYYPTLPQPLQFLARRAYFHPTLAINSSELNPPDAAFVGARHSVVVPLGIRDDAATFLDDRPTARGAGRPVILFVGFLVDDKGTVTLLEAAGELRRRGHDVEVRFMGEFPTPEVRDGFWKLAEDQGIRDRVVHLGVLTGDAKSQQYADADIFCFPSHFESETFGVVLLEAMQFELPVVTTRWRGIPSVVAEGETALLADIKDSATVADHLERLLDDPALREKLGQAGRRRFLELYEESRFTAALEQAIVDAVCPTGPRG
ncbi:MAG TPA: glycosyltransferase family 4 protein [Acidimicrobiales bacterium]|nr:glycosyltransferase family 4 protein [Acidimicrobiales bacterium]